MDEPVDGSSGGHGILEDLLPVGEGEIAGEQDTAALIAVSQEREQDLHLVATLLDVADVVDNQGVVGS